MVEGNENEKEFCRAHCTVHAHRAFMRHQGQILLSFADSSYILKFTLSQERLRQETPGYKKRARHDLPPARLLPACPLKRGGRRAGPEEAPLSRSVPPLTDHRRAFCPPTLRGAAAGENPVCRGYRAYLCHTPFRKEILLSSQCANCSADSASDRQAKAVLSRCRQTGSAAHNRCN